LIFDFWQTYMMQVCLSPQDIWIIFDFFALRDSKIYGVLIICFVSSPGNPEGLTNIPV
jgi:hypothetical protein